MSEEIRKWLSDIVGAIENMDIHLGGKRDFVAYLDPRCEQHV